MMHTIELSDEEIEFIVNGLRADVWLWDERGTPAELPEMRKIKALAERLIEISPEAGLAVVWPKDL